MYTTCLCKDRRVNKFSLLSCCVRTLELFYYNWLVFRASHKQICFPLFAVSTKYASISQSLNWTFEWRLFDSVSSIGNTSNEIELIIPEEKITVLRKNAVPKSSKMNIKQNNFDLTSWFVLLYFFPITVWGNNHFVGTKRKCHYISLELSYVHSLMSYQDLCQTINTYVKSKISEDQTIF